MQFKSLINPSFLVLALDLQEHLKDGWEIDPNNLPVNNFMYYEVHLIKDDEDVLFVTDLEEDVVTTNSLPPPKKAGRPVRKAVQGL